MADDTEEAEVEQSPYHDISKKLRIYNLLAVLGIVVSLALLAGSVFVVVHAGAKSMMAFEDLPQYQINKIAIAYRDKVKELDESMASTQSKIDGESGQHVLKKSRSLVDQILQREIAHDQILGFYAEAIAVGAEKIGRALEWNRYFQADIEQLREASSLRQASLQAVFQQYPPPLQSERVSEPSVGEEL